MKFHAYYLFVFLCIVAVIAIVNPVSANISPKIIESAFFIEDNGSSLNEPANYSIQCFVQRHVDPAPGKKRDESTEKIFSEQVYKTSGTCLPGNCDIWTNTYYYPHIDEQKPLYRCLISGSTPNRSFSAWNNTGREEEQCNESRKYYDIFRTENNTVRTYSYTLEYLTCEKTIMDTIHVRNYPCGPYLANRSINRKNSNLTQQACDEILAREIKPCLPHLREVNFSRSGYGKIICEYHFDISERQKTGDQPALKLSHDISPSPVESLYCALQQFLGGMCD